MKVLFQLILISVLPLFVFSQTVEEKIIITQDYNIGQLNELAKSAKTKAEYEKNRALELARQNGWVVRKDENGVLIELMSVTEDGTPLYFTTENVNAAKSTRANTLHNGGVLGLNIEGQNMTAHVWDGGLARSTHQEYDGIGGSNRFSIGDGTTALHYHSAHVTGTIIASGFVASAKGMAPQANAVGYEWNTDVSEATTAAAGGMLLSNHSYGWGASSIPDWYFGAYNYRAVEWDAVMYSAPYYLMVVSAGNDGNDNSSNGDPLDGNSSYDKLSGFKTAKNNIVVANANDANIDASGNLISVSINSGSSEGPCDDYRIKPDITGNGTAVYSSYESSDNAYNSISGTSMAAPNVTGTLLILQQYYNSLNAGFMRASTLKGLALHTADDAGVTGPDVIFGWGLLNAKEAANVILNNGAESTISEQTLTQGGSFSINVDSDGVNDLIASISWTDPAGPENTGTANLTTPVLINDLDIRITKAASTYYPYKLTSITTNGTGDNIVDPFEKVIVGSASGTYTITVTHKGSLSGGSQNFSLIVTGEAGIPTAPVANFSADNVTPSVGQTVTFTDQSTKIPTSWSWSHSPATVTYVGGTSSSSQNPQVTFDAAGSYTVTLVATNAQGSDDEVRVAYINASVSASATYSSGNVSTDFGFQSLPGASSCPATLSVNIPSGATITTVDVEYDMTADLGNNAWMSEQRSQLRCVSTGGSDEGTLYPGSGDAAGTYSYSRIGLTIANGVSGGGNINFEMHAGRSWGGSGCNTSYNQVDNNTWTITVYYTQSAAPPIAAFSADDLTPTVGQTVTFTDASTNTPTSWAWSFNPSTVTYVNSTSSSSQNPQLTFDAAGSYTVTLMATNAGGSDNEVKASYITASPSNDDCTNASAINEVTDLSFSTSAASASGVQPSCGGNSIPPKDIWYAYTATSKGNATIDLCGSSYNTRLTIWDACGGSELACNDDACSLQSSISMAVISGTTYYVQIGGNNTDVGTGDLTIQVSVAVPGLWTGTTSTDWGTSSNWDDGDIPIASTNVSIPTSPPGGNFPETNSGAGAECDNLTIGTGAHLNIPSNNTLTVNGSLTNNAGTSGLVIKSDAGGTGSLIHASASVNATIERYLTDGRWHFIGIPISSATAEVFHLPTGHSDIYLRTHIESSNTWDVNIVPLGTPLILGRGYETWVGDPSGGLSQPETVEFSGSLNTGDYTTGTGFYGLQYTSGHGLNLISNPFPSALQAKINTWTKNNIASSVWTWSDSDGNYLFWNGRNGSNSSGWGTLSGGIIPAMQGFFVLANGSNPWVTIPNSDRLHDNQPFYKNTYSGVPNSLRFDVSDNNFHDAVFVSFNDEATEGYDETYDVKKLFGLPSAPQLYTVTTGEQLSINSFPVPEGHKLVQLGLECETNGDFTFTASELDSFTEYIDIYLEDVKEGILQKLNDNPQYNFSHNTSDEAGRFLLHFGAPSGINDIDANNINIYSNRNYVYIQSNEMLQGEVSIYDMLGQEIIRQETNGENIMKIKIENGVGYYVVKVKTSKRILTNKVFIK